MNLEQTVRSILERAIEDGLVSPLEHLGRSRPSEQNDEELRGCVAVLRTRLSRLQRVPAPHLQSAAIARP